MAHQSVLIWLTKLSTAPNQEQKNTERKRYPLTEHSPNAMNRLPQRTPSPSKRRNLQDSDVDGEETEATPRPLNPVLLPAQDDALQRSVSSASNSTSSARSRSPAKQMADMLFAPQPIIFKQFSPGGPVELPKELDAILLAIEKRFSRGIGVVSDVYQTQIEKLADKAFAAFDDISYTKSANLPGPSPTPEQCAKAIWLAQRCEEGEHCEAAWNSSVHNYVLDLALHNNMFKEKVYFLNCTSARISPASLVPPGKAGTALNSKMIDFAIHAEPSERFLKALHERAQRNTLPTSVSHTLHRPLRLRPIGVSIETKLTGQNWDEAMTQVGIWTAAQFDKLDELVKETRAIAAERGEAPQGLEVPLPFLPIIIILGRHWNFLAATREPNGQTTIYHAVPFGRTSSPHGVYQIVTTLQFLACWVRDSYAGWFEKFCLGMREDEQTEDETNDLLAHAPSQN